MSIQDIIDLSTNEKEEFTGDLCLGIFCTKCDAKFEINPTSIAMATFVDASIWDYIKYVQNSKCRVCNKGWDESTDGSAIK